MTRDDMIEALEAHGLVVVSRADLAEALPFIEWGLGALSGSQDVIARLTLPAAPFTEGEG